MKFEFGDALKQIAAILACEPLYDVVALISEGVKFTVGSRAPTIGISWSFELDEPLGDFTAAIDRANLLFAAGLGANSVKRVKDTLEFTGEMLVEDERVPTSKTYPCCRDNIRDNVMRVREGCRKNYYETVTESAVPHITFTKDNISDMLCVAKCGDRVIFSEGHAAFIGTKAASVADLSVEVGEFVVSSSALRQIEKMVSFYETVELYGNPQKILYASADDMLLTLGGYKDKPNAGEHVKEMLGAERIGEYELSAGACRHMISVFRSGGKQSALATLNFTDERFEIICGDTFAFTPVSVSVPYTGSHMLSVEKMYSMFDVLPKGSKVSVSVHSHGGAEFILIRSGLVWHFTRLMGVTSK